MSFTATVKDEVSKLDMSETEKISELSAIVQNNDYSNGIKVITENNSVARLVYSLFKDLFNVYAKVSVKRGYNYSKNGSCLNYSWHLPYFEFSHPAGFAAG